MVSATVCGAEELKLPDACCVAVIVVRPGFRAVRVVPLMVAILGSAILKLQAPGEFDVGGTRVTVLPATEPKAYVIGANVPTAGAAAVTVRTIVVVAELKPPAGAW